MILRIIILLIFGIVRAYNHFKNCCNSLKLDKGRYCYIVRRVPVPTDVIISEMGVLAGFKEEVEIIPRRIPTKRLPWLNAPENIPGYKGRTMSKESIVILEKE